VAVLGEVAGPDVHSPCLGRDWVRELGAVLAKQVGAVWIAVWWGCGDW
jgi:hypothetical protein